MTAVPFDTLRFARRLEDAGLATSVAAGTSEALAEALTGVELATRSDVATARADLGRDIERTRTELKTDIERTRTELETEIKGVRAELKTEIEGVRTDIERTRTELKTDIELLRRDVTIRLGSMMIVGVGVLLAAIRYLPVHP